MSPNQELAQWAPSRLARVARSPGSYWILAALLAVVTATISYRLVAHADALQRSYGEAAEVLVTARAAIPGDVVDEATVLRAVPLALVPADAVSEVAPGATLARPISAGAVITSQDLSSSDQLLSDQAVIAIATNPTTPAVVAGQALLAIVHADPFSGLEPAVIEATVQHVDSERLSLVVARRDLVTLTSALQNGQVTIAVTSAS